MLLSGSIWLYLGLQDSVVQGSPPPCPLQCSATFGSLSSREEQVLMFIGEGKTTKEIAATIGCAATTIGEYRKRLRRKLGLHSTCELALCALRRRLGDCDGLRSQ